ncbi:cation:dicarboxylate symporter family transporter [Pedobacter zeae]|uniref:Aerobic C4-dicarboxylate transport protein n=1 Tax=Pedobacter zeae TaxID=1737356 RepID=A0A7W6K936_9SPHI|nr:cation:dicarboxylase symporter family transporter [Pedobacter zeae]MBB4107458.1 aerobic C4-dicarboxylate transport protein [Pedobacter zeae]GGG99197.1 C4-dicarboxylate ABC transporter [Pedobacter zeae]
MIIFIDKKINTFILKLIGKIDLVVDKLNQYLSLQIVLAIVAGVFCGIFYPATAAKMQWIGSVFVSAIEPFVAPVIFLTVVTLFGGLDNLKSIGQIIIKALIYFVLISTGAILFGIGIALLIQPGKINKALLSEILPGQLITSQYPQWVNVVLQNSMLILLLTAVILGLIINQSGLKRKATEFFDLLRKFVMKLLRYIFVFAPFVAFSGIAYTVGRYGMDSLLPIGKMLAGTYIAMFLFVFLVLGSILLVLRVNIVKFIAAIKNELLYALGTSSSSSVIPLLMDRLEIIGLKRDVVRVVTVTGNSLNLNGTCVYLGMSVIFLAQLYNINFSWAELLNIVMIILLTSKGATGIPGTGFLALVTTVNSIHLIPVEGLAVLLSIDRFMSEARAITNTIGHGVAALVISNTKK